MRYQFILEPYKTPSSRYRCPSCDNRQKTFARYIDTDTGEYIAADVGKCNRDSNCGYHYTPKQYFQENPNLKQNAANPDISNTRARAIVQIKPQEPSFIPYHVFNASQTDYKDNCFTQYLALKFGAEVCNQLIARYYIGSCKYWQGGTVFWQIDIEGRVRTGKLMLYRPDTGKRVKEPYNHIHWVHALKDRAKKPLYPDYNLKQCFFGEHLLQADKVKPVAIVESEKTAIIASLYLPEFIWLACGSKDGLNEDKCKVLQDRKVILYPDLKCYDKWNAIKGMLAYVSISDLIETKASEDDKEKGFDLADYLLKFDYRSSGMEATKTNSTPADIKMFEEVTSPDTTESGIRNPIKPNISRVYSRCFEGKTGKVYIQNPTAPDRYAVYSSIDAYNKRSELPYYSSGTIALQDFSQSKTIDTSCLLIKH